MSNLVKQIKNNNIDLKEAEIVGLLHILKNNKSLTNQDLISQTGIPKETLKQFKRSVANLLDDKTDDTVSLNEEGTSSLKDIDTRPYMWSLLGGNFMLGESVEKKVLDKIKSIRDECLVNPKREYDQFLATSDTVLNKAAILDDKGVVEGKSIAFIGDDDLNSLSLGLLNSKFSNITVFDVDPDILNSVKKGVEKFGLRNIECVVCDVRKGIDKKYFGKFDVVIFDPPYTRSGVALFLERSIELLGSTDGFEGNYIFMYYGNSFKSPEKILKIQEVINRFGLSIEDRIEKFARYTGADSIGSASSLYILKTSKFTKNADYGLGKIYTYENQKEEKFPFVDHMVFKIFNVGKEFTLLKNKLVNTLDKLCDAHKLKVVDRMITDFKGGGMTVTFVLSNSNLVAHTWPEFSSIHLDLITCSPIFNKDAIVTTLSTLFLTDSIEVTLVE